MKDDNLPIELQNQIAEAMKKRKPYLIAIEEEVQRIQHGSVTIEIYVRSGSVDKLEYKDAKRSWIREKQS